MVNRNDSRTRNPQWWTDKNASAWDRVKGALQRDWEQTKSDFSSSSGKKLNQNLTDTVKQSVGSEPLPPLGVKTRPTDPKVAAKDAEKARESMAKESTKAATTIAKAQSEIVKEKLSLRDKVGEAQEALASAQAKADEKLADARAKAIEKVADAETKAAADIAKERAKIDRAGIQREEAIARWQEAEEEVRYGYSVRSQYPADVTWDDKLEGNLRTEWDALGTGRSWDASRVGIRRGWDYAGRSPGDQRDAA